jgi:hypothetical protein
MSKIHCVKLKQLRLYGDTQNTFEYFPFDRFYLVPKTDRKIAFGLFRYSLIMNVDDVIKASLNNIRFDTQRTIDIKRDDARLKRTPVKDAKLPFLERLQEGEWYLVVPTYLVRDREIDPGGSKVITHKVRLAYTMSRAISALHNLHVRMPTITLHTPKNNIPVLCAICKRVADYHANRCTPGQAWCRKHIELNRLPVEDDFRKTIESSVRGGGEIR